MYKPLGSAHTCITHAHTCTHTNAKHYITQHHIMALNRGFHPDGLTMTAFVKLTVEIHPQSFHTMYSSVLLWVK